MSRRVDLEQAVGYALKRAQAALRAALDEELQGLGLTVPQYSCLEQLSYRPDRSNAELARRAFVSRQAMHQMLRGLVSDGLVVATGDGRQARFACTPLGERRIEGASRAVAAVEDRMLTALGSEERRRLLHGLDSCALALGAAPLDDDPVAADSVP